jgi:DNA (cytosine-5)-methyltransferase 1
MKYLSVCSGIEAATVAWEPLGWTPFAFAEIEPFPCAVLSHHYGSNLRGEPLSRNAPPNLGDMNGFKGWPDATIDVLVGGTPCQSFSVAGLRKGLADPRGNLALIYLAIADRYRPEWIIWENVPGVLSSNEGRDFGAFIGGLEQLGYHAGWRVLDAQYVRVDGFGRAVPQRRRRVFVVGHLGDWRRSAAVLFERESLQGHTPPRRQAGEGIAPTISARPTGGGGPGTDFDYDGGLICSDVATVDATNNIDCGDSQHIERLIACATADTLSVGANQTMGFAGEIVAHALRADGFDASEDGTGRGTPLVPIAFSAYDQGFDAQHNVTPTLRVGSGSGKMGGGQQMAVAFTQNQCGDVLTGDVMHSLGTNQNATGRSSATVAQGWAVRRLTPLECERLQGFPDAYTAVPYRNKPAADGPRYKALGNSMAVNAMRWLGRRIELVHPHYVHGSAMTAPKPARNSNPS